MVKNFGGNRGKKVARKHINNNFNAKLRLAQEEGEVYACVSKLLGNGMCHVNCLDNNKVSKTRLCIIRNKFRGRGKRDNTLNIGTYVLVGIRSWETVSENKIEKCDLISVYNPGDVEKLKNQVDKPWNLIHINTIMEEALKHDNDDLFIFDNENTQLKKELETNVKEDNKNTFMDDDDEIIDIDDI